MENWDLIIVGAGAGGLSAGIYGARSGLKTLIIEEKLAGGTIVDAPMGGELSRFSTDSGS